MVKEYGYEYDAVLNDAVFERTHWSTTNKKLNGALCLRSGRDALKVVAREYKPTTVYLPALSCDSMILPFEMYGHKIVFYRLLADYSLDYEYLKIQLNKEQQVLFLYMDYFGKQAISDEKLKEIRADYPNIVFIEDRTHNLIWERESSFEPDYTIASLRKWINTPDGGLLWSFHRLGNSDFSDDTSFSEKRIEAQILRHQFFETGDADTKLKYRNIFSTVSDIMDIQKTPARMTEYTYDIASKTDWENIRLSRKNNSQALISELKKCPNIQLIQSEVGKSDLYVPFLVNDRDRQAELSKLGIFNTIIWPLSEEQKKICKTACYSDEHMLAAPCDQRYTEADMHYIGKEIVRIFQ